jgi:hypothetical protein
VSDYGHELAFGVFLTPASQQPGAWCSSPGWLKRPASAWSPGLGHRDTRRYPLSRNVLQGLRG